MTTYLGKSCSLFILFAASAFRKLSSIYVFSYFPFGFEGRIWDLIVSVPDHCLSFYSVGRRLSSTLFKHLLRNLRHLNRWVITLEPPRRPPLDHLDFLCVVRSVGVPHWSIYCTWGRTMTIKALSLSSGFLDLRFLIKKPRGFTVHVIDIGFMTNRLQCQCLGTLQKIPPRMFCRIRYVKLGRMILIVLPELPGISLD